MNGMAGPEGYHEKGSSPDEVDGCREKKDLAREKNISKPPLAGCVHMTASKNRADHFHFH